LQASFKHKKYAPLLKHKDYLSFKIKKLCSNAEDNHAIIKHFRGSRETEFKEFNKPEGRKFRNVPMVLGVDLLITLNNILFKQKINAELKCLTCYLQQIQKFTDANLVHISHFPRECTACELLSSHE
jgi:hypothetical protein